MKVSYHKHWGNDGTVYNQSIRLTKEQFNHLGLAVQSEISLKLPRKNEYVFTNGYEVYLQPLKIVNGRICFLNHTQTRFINLFLKLDLKDRNTCLIF